MENILILVKKTPYLSLEIILDNMKCRLPGKNGREETYTHLCFLLVSMLSRFSCS